MAKTNPDVGTHLDWLGTILKYIKEYGVINIIKAAITLMFLSIAIRVCYDPGFLFDKYIEYMQKRHDKELVLRSEKDGQLKDLLPTYLYKYHADRVWLIQYHNGTKDWQHGTMRFEKCDDGVNSIKDYYTNFSLTWLDLPFYLKEHDYFIGSIDELEIVDKALALQLRKNHVNYIACVLIRSAEGYPAGVFGVTWNEIETDMECLKKKILAYMEHDRMEVKELLKDPELK